MKRALPVLLLASWLLPWSARADCPGLSRDMLAGINGVRLAAGRRQLQWDDILGRTAAAYARALAARGALSHRDESGQSALERYHGQGGTAVLVGEVLGTGTGAAAVLGAWQQSRSHREVLLDPRWTHAATGGLVLSDGAELWVAMFVRLLVEDLEVHLSPRGYVLEGRFAAAAGGVAEPVLYSGIWSLLPESWQPDQRCFRFVVPEEQGRLYHRLGYLADDGQIRITDVLFPAALSTSVPETAPR
jgi:hypothetical protein